MNVIKKFCSVKLPDHLSNHFNIQDLKKAIKFNVNINSIYETKEACTNAPFKTCLFKLGHDTLTINLYVLVKEETNHLTFDFYRKRESNLPYSASNPPLEMSGYQVIMASNNCDIPEFSYHFVDKLNNNKIVEDIEGIESFNLFEMAFSYITRMFHQIASSELIIKDNIKYKKVRTRTKRKTKVVEYCYKTLKINTAHKPCENLGGTHASPKLHIRRGHYRTLKSGKKTWVTSCIVGDIKDGMMNKDYEIKDRT